MITRRQFGLGCLGLITGLLPLHHSFAAASIGLPDPEPYAQLWNSSCEIAAATLGLRMLGQPVTEADLIVRLPVDQQLPELRNGSVVRWGDPNQVFVGTLDGDLPWNPGVASPAFSYGVYAEPLARAISELDPAVTAGTGITTDRLKAALAAGRPVVVWLPDQERYRQLPDASRWGTWTTWDGGSTRFAFREHTQVLVGYGPAGYRLANVGYEITHVPFINVWPDAEFERAFAVLNRMAMIL